MATVGFAIFLGSFVNHTRYGSLFLAVPGTFCIGPPLGTWIANNAAPMIRRGTALALLTTMIHLLISLRRPGAAARAWRQALQNAKKSTPH